MTYVGALTFIHTALSFVAIGYGILAVAALFHAERDLRWRRPFLITAILTSVTGYLFPFTGITPAFATGIVALIVLATVLIALRSLPAAWARWVYVGGMVISLYLLVFVLIAQAFLKLPALNRLAPTGTEPAFGIAQAIGLLVFVVIGITALRAYGRGSALVQR
ncbi:MAG: hypothetical protein DI533_04005 [Cereibacter sphaeroides]|uniref:Uncharacterized protein n=1 Tax=Cereibacter sphaeroides TaxID=1063 RepID=A0A2W5SD36_CERSP|nr:MAG: hypothetical protein DI533_04005 [Cereibacter sphaeroides]